ncbi:MAG: Probable lipoprotein transmembrane [uncultured Paraburkholderia sp.]|nr:MAG: Probable lipoprotein transmembrane [uncultured Paraburkholderia sp.]
MYNHDKVLVPPREVMARIAVSAENYAACKRSATVCSVIQRGNPQRHSRDRGRHLSALPAARTGAALRHRAGKPQFSPPTRTRATSPPLWASHVTIR